MVLVRRTATSLTPGAPPCGPSYSLYLGGTGERDAQLLVTLSWAGDDRFTLLRCGGQASDGGCEELSEDGWVGTAGQAGPSRSLVVLVRAAPDADEVGTAPAVALQQLRGDPLGTDALVALALAQDWHRLAEQVEADVAP